MSKSRLGLALVAAGLLVSGPVQAADSAPEPASGARDEPRRAPIDVRPVTVVLHTESEELTIDALRAAVARELGIAAVPADSTASAGARGVLTVTYRPATKELAISYSEPVRGTVTRVVPAPAQAADVADAAALVAGDLVRDQAADFLGVAPVLVPPASAPLPQPLAPTSPPPAGPPPAEPSPPDRLGNASFFFPLATNAREPNVHTYFDFNLLYGHIGELNGLEIGTVSAVSGDVHGLQASVLTNLVGGRVSAGEFSFLFNRARSVEGVQAAAVNRVQDSLEGLQIGALNLAGSPSRGVQLAGVNQVGDFEGVQIGLVNVAKRVHGLQIGLVNVADDVDGVPIGLISVSRAGGVHAVAWSSDTTYGNVGVKFATRYTYTMLSGAAHSVDNYGLYGGGFTIGASIPAARRIATDLDLQALHLFANTACCRNRFSGAVARQDDQSLGKVRAALRFELLPHFSLFAGGGVTGKVTYPLRGGDTEVRLTLVPELFGGVQL